MSILLTPSIYTSVSSPSISLLNNVKKDLPKDFKKKFEGNSEKGKDSQPHAYIVFLQQDFSL